MGHRTILFILSVLVTNSVAQNVGTCTVDDGGLINWSLGLFNNNPINDVDGLNLKFPFEGNLEVELPNDQDSGADYLDVTIEGSDLVFKTNDYFISNFEEDQRSQEAQQRITIARTVRLTCDGTSSIITFSQPVTDTNNNKPTFKSPSYTYSLPSPLAPKLDLSSVGDAITVEDLDFSNADITFNVEPSDTFAIETVSTDDKRTYRGILRVTKYTALSSQTILTVTATDSGDPTSTSDPVTITIDVDSANSISNPPTFSEAVYRFDYSTESGEVTSSDGKAIKITSTDPDNIKVGFDNPDFKATYDPSTTTVTIEYTGAGLEVTTDSVLVVTLTATLNENEADSSKAAILVDIPSDLVVTIPTFDRAYYTATYDSSTSPHTVTLDQEITVTEDATVSVENEDGDNDTNFNIEYTDSKWQLKVKTALGEDDLKAGGEKILTLHATVTQDTETYDGYATLIVKLPDVIESPKFTSPLYTAKYDIGDGNGLVTLDNAIVATSGDQTVAITLKDPSVNFEIVNSDGSWNVNVLEPLPQKDLIAGKEYVLTLKATIPGQDDVEPGYSTLTITPTTVLVPTFGESYYTATYQVDNNVATVEVSNGPIQINLGSYQADDITVTLEGDYKDQFSIVFDTSNNVCNINVTTLDQDVLDQGDDIILTMKATTEYSTVSSLLIITLPVVAASEVPQFSKAYYTATYTIDDGEASVKLDTDVKISSSDNQAVSVMIAEVNDYFELEQVDSTTWTLKLKGEVSDDDLKKSELIYTLQADTPELDAKNVGKATLIVHLPGSPTVPKFTQAYYSGEYTVEEGIATVTLTDGSIELSSTDSAQVNFVDNYAEYFGFNISGDPQISVNQNLEDTVVAANQEILLTLQVSLDGSDETETAIIKLKLPHVEVNQTLKFTEPSYIFSYKINESTPFLDTDGQTITLKNIDTNVDVAIEASTDYSSNFAAHVNTDGTVELTIAAPLDQDTLNSETDILLVLKATSDGEDDGFATVLINLPKKEAEASFKFTESSYIYSYDVDRGVTAKGNEVSLESGNEEASLTLTGTYSNNFDIALNADNTAYEITVNGSLDAKILLNEVDIVLTITATVDEVVADEATLVIQLSNETVAVTFSQAVYEATYNLGNDVDTVKITDDITLIDKYQIEPVVTLTTPEGLENNFELTGTGPYTITVLEKLNDTGKDISLTLVASFEGETLATAVVVITMPETPKAPQFSKSVYIADYAITEDANDEITSEDTITLDVEAVVELSGTYASNFHIDLNGDKTAYEVTVVSDLDAAIFLTEADIVLTITATVEGVEETIEATLVIQLPREISPVTFSKSVYEADYKNDADTLTVQGDIELKNVYQIETQVSLTAASTEIQNCFTLSENSPYTIHVNSSLPSSILNAEDDVILTLTASYDDQPLTKAIVVVTLPEIPKAPKFSEAVYTAKYEEDGENHIVSLEDGQTIATDATDPTLAKIVARSPYDTNFKINYDAASKGYTITVDNDLDGSTVATTTEIYVVLEVTVEGALDSNLATLVLKMPEKTEDVIPTFSQVHYRATYNDDNTVTMVDDITITSEKADETNVTVIDSEYFSAQFDGTSWQLKVDQPPEDTVLNKEPEIIVTLRAILQDAKAYGSATVIIELPKNRDPRPSPTFTLPSYVANYITDGDKPSISITNPIVAESLLYQSEVTVTFQEPTENFNLTQNGDEWTPVVNEPLDGTTLQEQTEIVLILVAHLENSVEDDFATLIIKLPELETISFGEIYYEATYKVVDDDTDTVDVSSNITVNDGADVVITGPDEYKDNFKITCDGTCTLEVVEDLTDVLSSESEILLVLEATKPDVTDKGRATVMVNLPLKETIGAPEFTETVYTAVYDNDTSTLTQVQIKGNVTGVDVQIEGSSSEITDLFKVTPGENDGQWDVTVGTIPSELLESEVAILLTLTATKNGVTGKAGLVVKLPKERVIKTPEFTQVAYVGTYPTNGEEVTLDNGPIKINGVDDVSTVDISIDGVYKDYFTLIDNGGDWTLTLNETNIIPDDNLDEEVSILLTLTATIDSVAGEAAIVIELPKKVSQASFSFDENVYMADYVINGDSATLELTQDIVLQGNLDGVKVEHSGDYKDSFTSDYTNGKVTVKVNSLLSADILANKPAISVDLVAKTDTESVKATVIVKLPKKTSPTIFYFEETVYMADYNDGNFSVSGTIKLLGDVTDVSVTISEDYKDSFDLTYADNTVTIELKDGGLSDVDDTVISVDIIAQDAAATTTKAALVVRLAKANTDTLQFGQVTYLATYTDTDEVSLDNGPITVTGSEDAVTVDIKEGDYSQYFKITASGANWILELSKNLDLSSITDVSILLTLEAKAGEVVTEVGLVVKLPQRGTAASFSFGESIYVADYEVGGEAPALNVDGTITVVGTDLEGVSVTLSDDYIQYFSLIYRYTDHTVTVTATDKFLPSDTLDTDPAITVDITATKDTETSKATLVVKLPKKTSATSVYFDQSVYTAEYSVDSDTHTLSVGKEIYIHGDSDGVADVQLDGDYKDNFAISYANNVVTLTVKTALTNNILSTESAITLKLVAKKDTEEVKAVLVIRLPRAQSGDDDSSDSKTGFIAAVSVLAVLLVASLVGSAVFYYLKFKRSSNNYNNMGDSPRVSERFRKNSSNEGKNKFEHPTRRATGVIKYPLEEVEVAGETVIGEDGIERRKSVAFDTQNIDELEIEKPEDDTDDNEAFDSDNDNDNEGRRSSRV